MHEYGDWFGLTSAILGAVINQLWYCIIIGPFIMNDDFQAKFR